MTALRGWCTSPLATANPPFQSPQAQLESGVRRKRPLRLEGGKDCKVLPILTQLPMHLIEQRGVA
jgi:hypothetical protein